MKKRPWTMAEVRRAREAWLSGVKAEEIARQLGRTRDAVRYMAWSRGWGRRTAPPWSAAEIAKLLELFGEGYTSRVIAEEIGRPHNSVRGKARQLGLRFSEVRRW